MTFNRRLHDVIGASGSLLCLGLDPAGVPDANAAERWCGEMLEACLEQVCAVKPNIAFFEQFGHEGYAVLERLRERVPRDRLFILDAKRSDIGSTAIAYARAAFDVLGADAVTLNPLMGRDSLEPFLEHEERGVFLLTRTSNPGAEDLLDLRLGSGERVFERIVDNAQRLAGVPGSIGYVVGATKPEAIEAVRRRAPEAPLLLPGTGAQGGDLTAALRAGLDAQAAGVIVPVSRGITAAGDPAAQARWFRDRINEIRANHGVSG